jgi:hypothetical protein
MAADAKTAMETIGEHRGELALVPVEERNLRGLSLAREMFTPEERQEVAALLSVPSDSPALMPYLALCIGEGFSPWANHVWLIPKKVKIKGRDGAEDREEEKHIPAVGRDGLLHKARQSPIFDDLDFGVVCEHDTFEAWYENREWNVLHRQASKPTEFAPDEAPDRWRGRVVGAWSMLFLKGKRPTYYFANLREHGRLQQVWAWNQEARKRKPLYRDAQGRETFAEFGERGRNAPVQEWAGAWDYLSTMILKSAQSYVCRIGLGVTGFVPVDELRDVKAWQEDTGAAQVSSGAVSLDVADFDFDSLDVPDELRERLRRAVDTANGQVAFSWTPAKCEMVFTARSADELAGIVEDIERENDLREQRIDRSAGGGAAAEPEEVTGEVVPPAEGLSAEQRDRVNMLRHRLADLEAARDDAPANSPEDAALAAEMDQVEAEIRSITGGSPDQGNLGV